MTTAVREHRQHTAAAAPQPAGSRQRRGDRINSPARQRARLTIAATGASLLAAMPLSAVFQQWTWLLCSGLTIVVMGVLAGFARRLRHPAAPTAAMLLGLPFLLTICFPSGGEILRLIPTPATVGHLNELLGALGDDLAKYSTPVSDHQSFLLAATLGSAFIAVVIDLFAVTMRRPALAGLPILAVYSVPVTLLDSDINMLTFACSAAGYLWLLVADNVDRVRRFGRRFSDSGRSIQPWERSPLTAAGQRLAIVAIVIAVVAPMAVPIARSNLLDRLGLDGVAGGGGSGNGGDTVSMSLEAALNGNLRRNAPYDILRVQTNDTDPFYLRYGIADQLSKDGFTDRKLGEGTAVTSGLPGPAAPAAGVAQKSYHANVEIVDLTSRFLPVYTEPTRFDKIGANWRYDQGTGVIHSDKETTKGKRYSFDYTRQDTPPEALRSARPVDLKAPGVNDAMGVPESAEVLQLVRNLTNGKTTQYDKVAALLEYFGPANNFVYSVNAENKGEMPILDFLLNTRKGFCVQYSAALAWLVRQAGFPARVAFGFTRGSAPLGTMSTLTNFNAHAWTEVYFQGFGWVPFDVTPSINVVGAVSRNWAPNPSRPKESANPGSSLDPSAAAGGPNGPEQKPNDKGAGPAQQNATAAKPGIEIPTWVYATIAAALAVLVMLAMPGLYRNARRRRRLNGRSGRAGGHGAAGAGGRTGGAGAAGARATGAVPSDAAERLEVHDMWSELLDAMVDYRLPIDEAETPRATAGRLAEQHLSGPVAAMARTLGTAEEQARYAQRPLPVTDLRSSVLSIERALADGASRGMRLRARFMPRSVLAHWTRQFEELGDRLSRRPRGAANDLQADQR